MINLRDALIRAFDNTEPCPDGSPCPSCVYTNLIKLLEEQELIAKALRHDN
jgi:hypothetical protein